MRLIKAALFLVAATVLVACASYLYVVMRIEHADPRVAAPDSTKFIEVGGELLAYGEVDNKSDTTVLFVGGLAAWNGTWQRVIDVQNQHSKSYNYVALDLPPFGYSVPDASHNFYRDTQAERIAAFVEKKQFKKLILVGHSYGGGPMTEYAMSHTQKVQKLILIDAVLNAGEHKDVSGFSPVQITPLRNLAVALLVHNDAIVLSRLKSFVYVQDHINADLAALYTRPFDTHGLTERLSSWMRDYVRDPLVYKSTDLESYKRLPFPVRLIWGDKDTLTPIAGAEALTPVIPDVGLATLRDVGHIPMIEDYAAFDAALSSALNK